jgi:Arc/MetJ-type ribon-helix-helix transcriptional regulator
MTRKIGVSLRDDLYEWAAHQVKEGQAESVSALIAHGLEVLRSRSELAEVVRDLKAEIGELDDETKARVDEAMRIAAEAQRRHLAEREESALWTAS